MTPDSAALMVIIELRQRIAELEAENAELRQLVEPPVPAQPPEQ